MKHTLIFLDVESTGKDKEDRLIQIAYKTTDEIPGVVNKFYSTKLKIKIEAMTVHHITEKMIEDKPIFKESGEFEDLKGRFTKNEILVAHRAIFDIGMLKKEGLDVNKYIDTFKVAHYLDIKSKIPSYSLQYLRYFLGIEIEASAHDALGDILVLELLFYRQLKAMMEKESLSQDTAIEKMIDVSNDPLIYKFFPFGKHKNVSLKEVSKTDPGYLKWLLDQKLQEEEKDDDWIATLKHFLHL